jgi:histidinol-phosphatase
MVDPIANPWDLAAVQPVVEEAGGKFTSWSGDSTVFGGDGVGSNGLVHADVLDMLR